MYTFKCGGWLLWNVILCTAFPCTIEGNNCSLLFHLSLLNFGHLVLDSGQRERMDRRDIYVWYSLQGQKSMQYFILLLTSPSLLFFHKTSSVGFESWLLCICCVLVHDGGYTYPTRTLSYTEFFDQQCKSAEFAVK